MDPLTIFLILQSAATFFGGQQKAESEGREAYLKQQYYNRLATAEEKRGFESSREIARLSGNISGEAQQMAAERNVMAAGAGYQGQSLQDLQSSESYKLRIDKEILKESARQAIQTSQEKAGQLRMAGDQAIEAGKYAQQATWLDTIQQIGSRWIPAGSRV